MRKIEIAEKENVELKATHNVTKDKLTQKQILINYANEIHDAELKNVLRIEKYEHMMSMMSVIRLNAIEIVNNAVDANGKPLYTNETKRKVAVEEELALDETYVKYNEDTKELKLEIDKKKIEITYLRHMFEANKF